MQLSAMSPAPGDVAARLALSPFTVSEVMKSLEPIGVDRWAVELEHEIWHARLLRMPNRWTLDFCLLVSKGDANWRRTHDAHSISGLLSPPRDCRSWPHRLPAG